LRWNYFIAAADAWLFLFDACVHCKGIVISLNENVRSDYSCVYYWRMSLYIEAGKILIELKVGGVIE
jgi:hypothetical protein